MEAVASAIPYINNTMAISERSRTTSNVQYARPIARRLRDGARHGMISGIRPVGEPLGVKIALPLFGCL